MFIRYAVKEDLNAILKIYEYARIYMREHGNPTQWGNHNPKEKILVEDIKNHHLFVGVGDDNEIHFVFAFIIGDDPTYHNIENGKWINENTYGTIHRLASDGTQKGVFKKGLAFCESKINNIRIDTHHDNRVMQHVIEANGFHKCGIIYVSDGTSRIAYQKENEIESCITI